MSNIRIKDLPATNMAADAEKLPIDGAEGTKAISVADLSDGILDKLPEKEFVFETEAQTIPGAINELHNHLGQPGTSGGGGSYTLPRATATALGGIKAEKAHTEDTQPVRIDSDGFLKTASNNSAANKQYVDTTLGGKVLETATDPIADQIIKWDAANAKWVYTDMPSNGAGMQGPPGAAAGFGVPTASVDNNVGTPSVTVTASGADTAKVFNFQFKNLKGARGDKGDPGLPGQKGADGKNPIKGADYWTVADKQDIVNDVLAALPTWTGGNY